MPFNFENTNFPFALKKKKMAENYQGFRYLKYVTFMTILTSTT